MKPTLTISTVCKSQIYAKTIASFTKLTTSPSIAQQIQLRQSFCIGQSDLPKGRSTEMSRWYEKASENDIFMFLDADQTFEIADILRSLSYISQYDIVCGAYPRATGAMTVEPKDIVKFKRDKEGPLYFGSTGFMMISYRIAKKMAEHFGSPIFTSRNDMSYPFFYERIVDGVKYGYNNSALWLGEDYSFCWLANELGGSVYGYISSTIGHIISSEKFVSIPTIKEWDNNSVVYYCGGTLEPWSALNIEKGIGGSESAVIRLSREWAKYGYKVTVFCSCDKPGVYDGVEYKDSLHFSATDTFNILIVWRNVSILEGINFQAKKCILDLHDVVRPEIFSNQVLDNVSKICVKSDFHKSMLGDVPDEKIAVIPNGGCCKDVNDTEKDPNYLIYASSYDRGLIYMLKWGWPLIKKECPDAYLKIFYGWNVFDAIHKNTGDSKVFKEQMIELMNQEGVEERGRVSNEELMKEKAKANIHYYMGDFQEIDCISVRESASLGTIPVVAEHAKVFTEKPYCVTVKGIPSEKRAQQKCARKIISLLKNRDSTEKLRNEIVVSGEETWENVSKKWLEIFA